MKDGITDLEKKIPSNEEHENFQTFEKIVNRETTKGDAPLAIEIKNNIPIYSGLFLFNPRKQQLKRLPSLNAKCGCLFPLWGS